MKWVCFSSQTGKEICALSLKLGRKPDLIITNRSILPDSLVKLGAPLVQVPDRPSVEDYRKNLPEGALITLHGWLRIVPEEICSSFRIFNGHPGLINVYPELKGKDPQERAWRGKYEFVGSVVHEVTPGVDEGKILTARGILVKGFTLNEVFEALQGTSLLAWLDFFASKGMYEF